VRVESEKATPSDMSIASPAWIITRLSMKPKPIIGMPEWRATIRSWEVVGSRTSVVVASVVLDVGVVKSRLFGLF